MKNLLIGVLLLSTPTAFGAPKELSISEVLMMAESYSPDLKASRSREMEAKSSLSMAKSYLYPSVDLSAVDSFGFAGSSSPTPPEFGGILNSPYRVGAGVGLVGKMTLFDLGNWYGVDASREDLKSNSEQTKVSRVRAIQTALSAYAEASRLRGDLEVWKSITAKVEAIEKTVKGFVRNGQYSDVSRLLIQDQGDEARMNVMTLEERYRLALKRLALLIGMNEGDMACPAAFQLSETSLGSLRSSTKSPVISQGEMEASAARFRASQESSKHLPKLFAAASAGYLNDARFVENQNYSVWVGVTLPLFEGFRISAQADRARATAEEKENQLSAAQLELDETNARYDESINVARMELKLLERQHESAIKAFNLAKQRYLSFLGTVIDLREAVRNLARIELQSNDKNADLILALGSKAALNGSL